MLGRHCSVLLCRENLQIYGVWMNRLSLQNLWRVDVSFVITGQGKETPFYFLLDLVVMGIFKLIR